MVELGKSGVGRNRWLRGGAALALAAMLAGCGGLADVGSAVVTGAEAVGTLVKKTVNDDEEKGAAEGKPAKPE